MTKQEYIKQIKIVAFYDFGDHIKTDTDDEAKRLTEDDCDAFACDDARMKGNIIWLDGVFMMWLDGAVWAWNKLNDKKLNRDEIIPNFGQVITNSGGVHYK